MYLGFRKKFILAVSGGPDSMAMLQMYKKKAKAVCCVNYNKRENSNLDVSIVREFCNINKINFLLYEVSDDDYSKHKKENFQSLAREIRYNFFIKTCNDLKCYKLMIAHNLNDLLETAYMQFQKKSKSLYYGLKSKSKYKNIVIYRPLLRFKKVTLQRHCDQLNIKYAIDYTNDLNIYERNRVRKIINTWDNDQILDYLKKIKKYNKQHKRILKQVNKTYKEWEQSDFSITYIKTMIKNNYEVAYHLIYCFLKQANEKNNSHFKIENILNFIKKASKNKFFRLEQNKHLYISSTKIYIK